MRPLLLSTALALLPGLAGAEDIALVLGVDRYEQLGRLARGAEPVQAVDGLTDLGFAVEALPNGRADTTARALASFAERLPEAERIIVVLSGRFATDGVRTWMLTAETAAPSLFAMEGQVSVESLLVALGRSPGQALLLLGLDPDAAGDFDGYLAEGIGDLAIPQGVTLAMGDPRDIAALLAGPLAVPGADLIAALAETDDLIVGGYLPRVLPFMPAETPDEPVVVDVEAPDPAVERSLWDSAVALDTVAAYRDYLSRYPLGLFAAEAEEAIATILAEPNRDARLAEDALQLSRSAQRAIQENLAVLDFDPRGIDGIFGPGTRRAIANWQQVNGYAQTTYLDREQIGRLDAQASRRRAELAAEAERQAAEAARLDRLYWDETGADGDAAGLRAYLDRYPRGLFAAQAQAALDELAAREQAARDAADSQAWAEAAATDTVAAYRSYVRNFPDGRFVGNAQSRIAALTQPQDEQDPPDGSGDIDQARQTEALLGLNGLTARMVESRLSQMGLDVGEVDGQFDDQTRRAIARYQDARDMPVTGYLDELTLVRLLADTLTDLE
jgi:peptidoglycan hydrolase-like protein with peptidoglycan-binding domain